MLRVMLPPSPGADLEAIVQRATREEPGLRYATVDQLTQVTPPQGTFCLADGTKPANITTANPTGYIACTGTDPAPGFFRSTGPRGNTRDSHNETFHNQTDLSAVFGVGAVEHRLTAGASITSETFFLDTGNIQRTATGGTVAIPDFNIANPNNTYTGAANYIRGSTQEGTRQSLSVPSAPPERT